MNKKLLIVFAFLLFNIGYGQTLKTWTGAVSTAWDLDENWDGGEKPTSGDNVLITNTPNQPVITTTAAACAALELLNSTAGSTVVLTVRGKGSFSLGSIVMHSNGGGNSNCSLNIDATGKVSVTGNVTMTGTALQNDVTFSGEGNLLIGGVMTGGTLNSIGKGTVTYNGTGTRTIGAYNYNNLALSGSGVRNINSGVNVDGTFIIAGTATATAAPTYGADAGLQYSTTSFTVGPEWVSPFIAKGGVQISPPAPNFQGVVTLNNGGVEKRFSDGVPLMIDLDASLVVNNTELYLGGDFINNTGLLQTDGYVYLTGGVNQSIDSFISTKGVVMNKTASRATFTGNINTKELIINGAGTLNLGSGWTHTFTNWVRTQGTLNAGTSLLKISGNVLGTGGSFIPGTGTVEFNGGAQNLGSGSITYNNLTLSGSGTKTFGVTTTINETISIASGVIADLTANLVHTAKSIKVGVATGSGGSWGNSLSNAVNKNDSFFASNNGIINVGPTIAVSTDVLPSFTTIYGTPSVSNSFTLSGIAMVNGILVSAPTGFEVSTDGTTFSDTLTVGASGAIASTTVFVRLKGTVPAKNYVGNIVLTSNGTTTINVAIATSTVNKAPLTITAEDKQISYGDAIPVLTVKYDKLVNEDTEYSLTTKPVIATLASKGSNAGTYDITVSGANSSNYEITYGLKGKLLIDKVGLTITTVSDSRTYGSDNPVLRVIYSDFVNEDTEESLTFTKPVIATAAKKESPVVTGGYQISASGASSLNYNFNYKNVGILTIDRAKLKITADKITKTHGENNPTLTFKYSDFVNEENELNLTTKPVIATTAVTNSAIGEYPIIVSAATSSNYTIEFVDNVLEVVASKNAGLSDIVISKGDLDPAFDTDKKGYTVEVPNETNTYVINPIPSNPNATVVMTVDGVVIDPTKLFDLKVGDNEIKIVVTAEDGTTQETYTVIVNRDKSNNSGLTDLAPSAGTLSPTFAEATTAYTDKVPNDVTSITLTPVTADTTATVTINGVSVPSGTASGEIPLQVGENTITTVVTAEDGTTTTYTVVVTREPSNNSGLTDLAISEGTLSPAFTEGTTAYTATVPNDVTSITATTVTADPTATITVNGISVPSGTASADLPLKVGENEIITVVTAQDGTTTTYTVVVTREPSSNADLSDIVINGGDLSPAFNTDSKGYTVEVPYETNSYVINPIPADPTATVVMTVDGKIIDPNAPIDLNVGENVITIVVTAEDGITQETYEVIVIRDPANNSGLTDLTISEGTLSPAFAEGTTAYTATVPNDVANITVTPVTADSTATVTVNGVTVPSGTASADLPLQVGENTITTVVTAQDGTSTTYTVVVTREEAPASNNAGLSDIVISDGALSPAFNTDTNDYRVDVPNETNSYVVTPITIDPNATVEMIVDGKVIDPTSPIDLNVGDNVITIVVTAPDGTTDTYIVIVNRADAEPQVIVPTNIITPNGDGKNDYWVVPGIDQYPNNSVKVFDRAARLVYSKDHYDNTWDGTYKGSPLTQDTYYYLIDLGNGQRKLKGFITIIRD